MASYREHLMFSSVLGASYGSLALLRWDLDWGPVFLAAGLTTLGGIMPDLDSDSGVPVRELFGVAAAVTPFLLYEQVHDLFGRFYVASEKHNASGLHLVKHCARSLGQLRARQPYEQQSPGLALDPLRALTRSCSFSLRHKFGFVASLMFKADFSKKAAAR